METPRHSADSLGSTSLIEEAATQRSESTTSAIEPLLATPWQRYWARMVDTLLWIALASFPGAYAIGWLAPELFNFRRPETNGQIIWIILLPIAMVIDALVHAMFGNTPGRLLSGIRVQDINGDKLPFAKYLRRNVGVYVGGLALGIPIVALFTLIHNHRKVKEGRLTSWDEQAGSRVISVPGVAGRTSLAAVVYFALFFTVIAIGTAENKTPEEALREELKSIKPTMIDKETRLDSVSVEPGPVVKYNYTLISISVDALDAEKASSYFQEEVRPGLVRSFCSSWDTRGLRAFDATIRFRYFDKNGKLIATIAIAKRDCPSSKSQ